MKTRKNFTFKQKRPGFLLFKNGTILTLLALSTLFMVGCVKYKDDYPGLAIYKTNADYFYNVQVQMKKGEIYGVRNLHYSSRLIFTDTDTVYKNRIRLTDGYVLDCEAGESVDLFTDLTIKQYYILETKFEGLVISIDTLNKHIIKKYPFTEFYREIKAYSFDPIKLANDTAELNRIIRNGELDKYFKRIK